MEKEIRHRFEERFKVKINKKFDCDWSNYSSIQSACGECRVCKYYGFLDYCETVGKPESTTIKRDKVTEEYIRIQIKIFQFYKDLVEEFYLINK